MDNTKLVIKGATLAKKKKKQRLQMRDRNLDVLTLREVLSIRNKSD